MDQKVSYIVVHVSLLVMDHLIYDKNRMQFSLIWMTILNKFESITSKYMRFNLNRFFISKMQDIYEVLRIRVKNEFQSRYLLVFCSCSFFFFFLLDIFFLHLKFLTSTTHLIYRILTIHGTIIIGNKILFNFKITRNKLCLKKNKQTLF